MRDEHPMRLGVDPFEQTGPWTDGALIADAPNTMTAWPGVLVGPFAGGDDSMEQALSQLQAELDEKGREAEYRIEVESAEDDVSPRTSPLTADGRARVTAWIGVLVGVLAPIAILESPWPSVRLVGALVFVLVGAGPGITCWLNAGDSYVQAALTIVLSAAAFALAAVGMIWLSAWHPTWLVLLAVPSVLSCLYRLYRLNRRRARDPVPSAAGSRA